jgi:hypothetical protein
MTFNGCLILSTNSWHLFCQHRDRGPELQSSRNSDKVGETHFPLSKHTAILKNPGVCVVRSLEQKSESRPRWTNQYFTNG